MGAISKIGVAICATCSSSAPRRSFSNAVRTSSSLQKLHRGASRGAGAEPMADVVAADHEILPVIGSAAHQHMDVRIVCIPVIDRDPIERHSEITLGIAHELPGEAAQILHLGSVFGRDRQAK